MEGISQRILCYMPGLVAGLYVGRLLSEGWAEASGQTPAWLALLLTLAASVTGALISARFPLQKTWPILLLLGYVFYPEANLTIALLVALFTLLTALQVLWSPLEVSGAMANLLPPLVLLIFCFGLYLWTLAPDLLPADSGEFQLVAANLGVAHPPGFSLYTMLAHLMTRLPLGPTPAFRVNLFSAVTSTLTLAVIYATIFILSRRHLAAMGAVLALGTSTTFWAQATTANIRSMTALFAAVIFLLAVLFYGAIRANSEHRADRFLFLLALTTTLGVSHHASLIFIALIAFVFILLVDNTLWRTPSRWWRPFLGALLGFLPLLYLPLRAQSGARGASVDLATWSGFVEHVLALGFSGDLFVFLQPALFIERLRVMGNVLTFQFSPWLLLIIAIGLLRLLRQSWRLAFLFGGSTALFTLITATYRAPQTVEYMLPAYVALTLLLGTAAGGLVSAPADVDFRPWEPLTYLLSALLITASVSQLLQTFDSYSWLSKRSSARDYANEVLLQAPPDAVILANWHWATPFWYVQEVERQRPDVDVRYVFPEGEPYPQTWARRIDDAIKHGRVVIATNYDDGAYAALPPAQPLADAFLFPLEALHEIPPEFTAVDLNLGEAIAIQGYTLETSQAALDDELILTVAWRSLRPLEPGTSLFSHLIAADGRLAGQQDLIADAQTDGFTLTQFRITPFAGAQPGSYQVMIGAYAEEPLPDASGAARSPLTAVELSPARFAPATANPVWRRLVDDSQRQLTGFDWDSTVPARPRLYLHWSSPQGYSSTIHDDGPPLLPPFVGPWGIASHRWSTLMPTGSGHYVPLGEGIVWTGDDTSRLGDILSGGDLVLRQRFLSRRPIEHDIVVSTRLVGFEEDGFHWAWSDLDDAIPAMGAIPTLKWISGSRVTSPHFLTADTAAEPGQVVSGILTMYDAFTGRLLPILDDRLTAEFGWIPLGKARMAQPALD